MGGHYPSGLYPLPSLVQTPAPGDRRPVNRGRQIAAVAWKGGEGSPKVFCVRAWLTGVLALFSELGLGPNITTPSVLKRM